LKLNLKVALVSSIGAAILYVVMQPGGFDLVMVSDILCALVSGLCAFFAFLVVLKFGARGIFGSVNLGLFLAVFLWFLGEVAWGVYEVVFHVLVPYPSVADVFYLLGYAPAIISVILFLRILSKELTGLKVMVALLVGLIVIGLTFSFLLNPLLSSSTGFLTKVFDLAYPSLDSILLILAFMMLLVFAGAPTSMSWFWISVGIILMTIADISFSFGTLYHWYYSGHATGLLYVWSYISLALGFDNKRKQFD
jgi:hypothetical protein